MEARSESRSFIQHPATGQRPRSRALSLYAFAPAVALFGLRQHRVRFSDRVLQRQALTLAPGHVESAHAELFARPGQERFMSFEVEWSDGDTDARPQRRRCTQQACGRVCLTGHGSMLSRAFEASL